jgi:predicted Zn-ribbon and HTH transcriptional regulator
MVTEQMEKMMTEQMTKMTCWDCGWEWARMPVDPVPETCPHCKSQNILEPKKNLC